MRLNKFLSDAGVCSRRQADRLVEEGRVQVDGRTATLGEQVEDTQIICVDGKEVHLVQKKIILAFHKPKGIVCTAEKREKNNIIDYIGYPERIYPVGRLDKESSGLILLTNDGELMNEILRARNYHEKEYEVKVNRPVTSDFLNKMSQGVEILDTVTRPCEVHQTGVFTFRIILTQGLNRQIRRMCEALDYRVRELKRYRIMNIYLGDLPEGQYCELTGREYRKMMDMINHKETSSSETMSGSREQHISAFRKTDRTGSDRKNKGRGSYQNRRREGGRRNDQ